MLAARRAEEERRWRGVTAELVCLLFLNLVKVDFHSHIRQERRQKWKYSPSPMPFGCDYAFVYVFILGKKINKSWIYTSMWPAPQLVKGAKSCASALKGCWKYWEHFRLPALKNFILGFQYEKGTGDERAEPKLKPARAIMCSLAVSAGGSADHLLLNGETLLTSRSHSYSNACSVIFYCAFLIYPKILLASVLQQTATQLFAVLIKMFWRAFASKVHMFCSDTE